MDERRVLLVTGEASGDRLAAGVLREASRQHPDWRFEGLAGPASRAAGAVTLGAPPASAMGLVDVLPGIVRLGALARRVLARAHHYHGALLVDLHGFTLPLGRALRRRGVPVVLLAAPQVWAWRPRRARHLACSATAIACLLDFEPPTLRALGATCTLRFVGHPAAEGSHPLPCAPATTLALLPGSRAHELRRLLPPMLATARALVARGRFPGYAIAVPPERARDPALNGHSFRPGLDAGRALLVNARAALACSGTVTLECVLAGVPTAVAFRTDPVTAFAARHLLRTRWIALPNILLGRPLLPELVQGDVTPERLAGALERTLTEPFARELRAAREELTARLRVPGGHAARVVALLAESLRASVTARR